MILDDNHRLLNLLNILLIRLIVMRQRQIHLLLNADVIHYQTILFLLPKWALK